VTTDGLQLKVKLVTLKKKQERHPFRAEGVEELPDEGYASITGNMDLTRDKRGIYRTSSVNAAFIGEARCIGIDPGQKDIITASSEILSHNSFETHNDPRTTTFAVSSEIYKHRTLMTLSDNQEEQWKDANVDYKNALDKYKPVSLTYPGKSKDYVVVFFDTLPVVCNEHMRVERKKARFARFRARQRFFSWLSRKAFYCAEIRKLNKMNLKGKRRRKMKNRLFNDKSVKLYMSYGIPTFGHGRLYGPTPTKEIIRECAKRGPILLANEHLTSKRHHVCGQYMKPAEEHRVLRCRNNDIPAELRCNIRVGRDVNGSMNMGRIGADAVLYGRRPWHLPLPNPAPPPNNA